MAKVKFSLASFNKQLTETTTSVKVNTEAGAYKVKLDGLAGAATVEELSTIVRAQEGDRIKVGLPKSQKGALDINKGGLSGKEYVVALFNHYGTEQKEDATDETAGQS
jgi:hypothetical protein